MASTSSRPLAVIDASVVVKWLLQDEPDSQLADSIFADFRDGRIELLAPVHLRYEVPSAIRNALRTGRLTPEDGRSALIDFFAWEIPTVDDDELIQAGFDQALQYGCSLYDDLYLALAENLGCRFVFADRRLRNALGTRFPLALWFSSYAPLT